MRVGLPSSEQGGDQHFDTDSLAWVFLLRMQGVGNLYMEGAMIEAPRSSPVKRCVNVFLLLSMCPVVRFLEVPHNHSASVRILRAQMFRSTGRQSAQRRFAMRYPGGAT
jgi:hypothetical protein